MVAKRNKKILFVCSAGGHLAETLMMEKLYQKYEYLIVTEDVPSARFLSETYAMKFIKPDVEGRRIGYWWNIFMNFFLSLPILIKFRPDLVITTGSHTAFPMCVLAKILRIKVVYILSYARVNTKAKSANIIYPLADVFLVQWKSAQKLYPKSIYKGSLF